MKKGHNGKGFCSSSVQSKVVTMGAVTVIHCSSAISGDRDNYTIWLPMVSVNCDCFSHCISSAVWNSSSGKWSAAVHSVCRITFEPWTTSWMSSGELPVLAACSQSFSNMGLYFAIQSLDSLLATSENIIFWSRLYIGPDTAGNFRKIIWTKMTGGLKNSQHSIKLQ
jgi:hypothetical protein